MRWRIIRRQRARELRDQYWDDAQRAEREGDHRRARQMRVSSLAARREAEVEFGWRRGFYYA